MPRKRRGQRSIVQDGLRNHLGERSVNPSQYARDAGINLDIVLQQLPALQVEEHRRLAKNAGNFQSTFFAQIQAARRNGGMTPSEAERAERINRAANRAKHQR